MSAATKVQVTKSLEFLPRAVPIVRNPVDLVLSAKRQNFRHDDPDADEKDAAFEQVKRKVKDRDDMRCRGCGFQSKLGGLYMQVHHVNDDHGDNDPANLVVLCMHCHATFHCGFWGRNDEARIVYLPELEQWQVSHLCRLGMVAKVFATKCEAESSSRQVGAAKPGAKAAPDPATLASRARSARAVAENVDAILTAVHNRQEQAEKILGTSDPAALAEALVKIPPDKFMRRGVLLEPFRLFIGPKHRSDGRDVFPEIAASWLDKAGPFSAMDPSLWGSFLGNAK